MLLVLTAGVGPGPRNTVARAPPREAWLSALLRIPLLYAGVATFERRSQCYSIQRTAWRVCPMTPAKTRNAESGQRLASFTGVTLRGKRLIYACNRPVFLTPHFLSHDSQELRALFGFTVFLDLNEM